MAGFFMLSGYSLWLAYGKKPIIEHGQAKQFFIKRLISIYPLYFVIGCVAVIMEVIAGLQTVRDNLILIPVELFGIQAFFEKSLFTYAHNGGTWFVSCLLICYFLFPWLKELVSNMTRKQISVALILFTILLSYFHYLPKFIECGSLYTNAYLRVIEFVLGILLAVVNETKSEESNILRLLRTRVSLFLTLIVLFVGNSAAHHFGYKGDLLVYVCLISIFLNLGYLKSGVEQKRGKGYEPLMYASSITYAFYLGQFFVWKPLKFVFLHTGTLPNCMRIGLSFILCVLVSIVLHEVIEKKCKQWLLAKWIK